MSCLILVITLILLSDIHLSWGLNKETIVSIDDKDKTQYHEVNFDTRSYNFGYEVGENRQFHHEIRGADGVTYGCFGYFDVDDKLLVTYYVADAHGYRLIEANKPAKIFPVITDPKLANENSIESKQIVTEWKDLFLPSGCRAVERNFINSNVLQNRRFRNDQNQQRFNDIQIPQPGIGRQNNVDDENIGNDPSRTGTGGIGGGFSKPGSSGSFGIIGTHGQPNTATQTQPTSSQNSNTGGSGFGLGGGFIKPDGTQGGFQIGITKPPHQHGSHLGSLLNHTHGHEHGSGQHVIQKPPGHIGGISWTGHNITIQKPTFGHNHSHIDHSSSNHTLVISKPPGSIQGPHGGGISWSSHNITIQKPTLGHGHNHTHESGGQHVIQKPPGQIGGISWSGQNITIQKPTFGHNHSHGHVHEKPPGHVEGEGSFTHGNTQGGHQGGISWGGHQGGVSWGGNQGQYYPDNSGQYVHQPGPYAPPYQHTNGPQGSSGSNGYGGESGYNGGNGQGGNYGPSYGYHHQGGYRPDPNNPDSHCNNPDHNHYPHNNQNPYYKPTSNPSPTTYRPSTSKSTTTRPTTTTTTTTKRPQTYPTRPSNTPNPTGSGSGYLGVQPPSTTPNPAYAMPSGNPPYFFVPYPFPIAPSCPCYYMHSHGGSGNFSSSHINSQFQWQSQYQNQLPYGFIGVIPILFVPHCMSSNGNPNQIPGQYMQVPYPCAQCNQQLSRDALTVDEQNFSSSDSFQQVLAQAGVNSFDTFVRTQPRRMRVRKQKRIQQKIETEAVDTKSSASDVA